MIRAGMAKILRRTIAIALIVSIVMAGCALGNVRKANAAVKAESKELWKWTRTTNFGDLKEGETYNCFLIWGAASNASSTSKTYFVLGDSSKGAGKTDSYGVAAGVEINKNNGVISNTWGKDVYNYFDPEAELFYTPELPEAMKLTVGLKFSENKSEESFDYYEGTNVWGNTFDEWYKEFSTCRLFLDSSSSNEMLLYNHSYMTSSSSTYKNYWHGTRDLMRNYGNWYLVKSNKSEGGVRLAFPSLTQMQDPSFEQEMKYVMNGSSSYCTYLAPTLTGGGYRLVGKTCEFSVSGNNDWDKKVSDIQDLYLYVGSKETYTILSGEISGQVYQCNNALIESGKTLTVDANSVLIVNGQLINNGTIENYGIILVKEGASVSLIPGWPGTVGKISCDGKYGQGNLLVRPGGFVQTGNSEGSLLVTNGAFIDNNGDMLLPYGVDAFGKSSNPDQYVTVRNNGRICIGASYHGGMLDSGSFRSMMDGCALWEIGVGTGKLQDYYRFISYNATGNLKSLLPGSPAMYPEGTANGSSVNIGSGFWYGNTSVSFYKD